MNSNGMSATELKINASTRDAIEKALNWVRNEVVNGRIDSAENWLATAIRLNANYREEGNECTIANKIMNAGMTVTFARL